MLVKLVILALAGYVLYRLFMNDNKKNAEKSAVEKENLVASGEMVKDPMCGAYVEKNSGPTVRNGDKVYHFCSYDCRDKYVKQIQDQQKIET